MKMEKCIYLARDKLSGIVEIRPGRIVRIQMDIDGVSRENIHRRSIREMIRKI